MKQKQDANREVRMVVEVPADLRRRFKIACINADVQMKDVLAQIMAAWLEKPSHK